MATPLKKRVDSFYIALTRAVNQVIGAGLNTQRSL